MSAYVPPPTGAQFHAAYRRTQDALTRTRARVRAEQAAAEVERTRPPQGPPEGDTTGR